MTSAVGQVKRAANICPRRSAASRKNVKPDLYTGLLDRHVRCSSTVDMESFFTSLKLSNLTGRLQPLYYMGYREI